MTAVGRRFCSIPLVLLRETCDLHQNKEAPFGPLSGTQRPSRHLVLSVVFVATVRRRRKQKKKKLPAFAKWTEEVEGEQEEDEEQSSCYAQ